MSIADKPPAYIWFNGSIKQWSEAKIPILTHALHYGTAVFEGIRAYPSADNLNIFRLREHLERLFYSAKIYYLNLNYSVDDLIQATIEVIRSNGFRGRTYIRPIVFVGFGGIGLDYTGFPVDIAIIAVPFERYFHKSAVRAKVSSWRRISNEANPPLAKASGNYLNSALAKQEAIRDGYDEAILLDQRGYVAEGTGENIFLIKDGIAYTPPINSSILIGITRDTTIKLLTDLNYKVVERDIERSELYICDEAFFCGTAAEITPIVEIDKRRVGNGEIGPITRQIKEAYLDVVEGRNKKYAHWLTAVY
ncbi:MAG: branched-chain amino acid transaminase [Nitrososphaerales archaeon]